MSVLDRKLGRELHAMRGRLLAIASILAIGVACYVALGTAYRNLSVSQMRYYAQCRMADFTIELKKIPLAEIAALADLPGMVELRARIRFFATVDLPRQSGIINGLIASLPDQRTRVIDDIVLARGSYFTDRRANEVIVNDSFARQHGLHPGQWVYLLLNDRRQELFIVGTAVSSEFTYLLGPGNIVPDPSHFGVFYLKQTFAEEVYDFQGAANQILGRLSPALRERPDEILRRAELMLADYGVFSTTPLRDQPSNRFLSNEIQGLQAFGIINPAIFLSVSVLVLNVLLSRMTEQQRVVVGTLRALGYGQGQIFGHFLKFGLCVGLAGGLVGCLMGYGLAEAMTALYRVFFQFPHLHNQFYPFTMLSGILIGVVCGVLGAVHGAWAVARLDPAESMRQKPPAQGGAIWLEHVRWLWRRMSFGWRMTLRNIVRNRMRTLAGMFAAAMGACVSVNALMLARATSHMVDFQFEQIMKSDVDLAFKDEQGIDALLEVRQLPGVDLAEPVLDVACTLVHGSHRRKGGISGLIPGATLTVPRDAAANALRIPSAGLLVSRKLATLLHLRPGDLVTIEPVKGLREPKTVPVVEIVDSYIGMVVYADIHYLSRLIGEELAITGAQLKIRPGANHLATLQQELKQMPALQAVTVRADTVHSVVETLVKNQRVFIGLLVVFAGTIFFGSVLNSSLIALAERTREVATLLVLGYTPWSVGGLFLRESMLTNLLGTAVGLPLGYLLCVGITIAYDTDMFRIPVVDPRWIWLGTTCLGIFFGLVAHLVVQRSIFKMDWLEALKTKE